MTVPGCVRAARPCVDPSAGPTHPARVKITLNAARAASLALALSGCGSGAQARAVDMAPPPSSSVVPRAGHAGGDAQTPGPISEAPPELDLSITFHPGFTSHLGWVQLKTPISLQYVGSPGAKIQRFDGDWQRAKVDAGARRVFEMELAAVDWPSTSVLLDEGRLCSAELHDAVVRANPARLLLRVDGGLSAAGVACLGRLPAARLYLAGCLYRSHRPEDRCDGDAEIRALAADEGVRTRVAGLAFSVSTREALLRLRRFPALAYLAIVAGPAPAPDARFDALPFEGLPELRYLDVSNWEGDQQLWGRPEALGQLRTLRWHGELNAPIAACRLRRLSSARLTTRQLTAFAACTQLVELSTDDADVDSAARVATFSRLEHLHLRHLHVEDLSPLGSLRALRELSVPAGSASAFGFVAQLSELRVLDLSQTGLSDLTPLARLQHLEQLDVGFTAVSDLAPLRGLGTLVDLDLHHTAAVDVSPLAGLPRLEKLSLSETPVTDLRPLSSHPSLEWVLLYGSKVRDVGALLTKPRLRRAHVGGLSLPPEQLAALAKRLGGQLDGVR